MNYVKQKLERIRETSNEYHSWKKAFVCFRECKKINKKKYIHNSEIQISLASEENKN